MFAIILPENGRPTRFKFTGTQTGITQYDLVYEGYIQDSLIGIVKEQDGQTFTVALAEAQFVVNDCHGRWLCDRAESTCRFVSDINDDFTRNCSPPRSVSALTW